MAAPSGRKPDLKSTGKAPAVDKKDTGKAKAVTGKAKAITGERPAVKAPSGKAAAVDKAPSGKAAAVSKAPSGKAPAAKTTSSRKAVAMPMGGGSRPSGAIWLTCRECGEEWTVDPRRAQTVETIACPICEHHAQAPSDDILHQIALYKGIEGSNLRMGLVSLLAGLVAMVAWTLISANPTKAEQPALFYAPILVAVVGLIGTTIFAVKYENSRWETYF
jgi:hypothetical protein